ncbi:MAG: FIST N-terminal domain-containing protein, partial [Polyangiaceae bacterium]
VSLSSAELRATPYLISQLRDSVQATDVGYRAVGELVRTASQTAFGLLLVDGLSNAEERVTAALFQALGDVPLVGGSAADELSFRATHVYCEGEFHVGAAVFVLLDTTLPFTTFKVQSVSPTAAKVVITRADAAQRIVFEIDGKPAVAAYAEKLGCTPEDLVAECRRQPLLLRAGDEYFVRGIRAVNPNGSLSFACAVEEGLVFTIGAETPAVGALREGLDDAAKRVESPAVVLGFDCVSRRLEIERRGEAAAVGALFESRRVIGFCTYGEQFDSLHLAQTFTGVMLGGG